MTNSRHYVDYIFVITAKKEVLTKPEYEYTYDGERLVSQKEIKPATYVMVFEPKPPFETKYRTQLWCNKEQINPDTFPQRFDLEGKEILCFCSVIKEHLEPGFLPDETGIAKEWFKTFKNVEGKAINNWDEAKHLPKVVEHYGDFELEDSGQKDELGNPVMVKTDRVKAPHQWF